MNYVVNVKHKNIYGKLRFFKNLKGATIVISIPCNMIDSYVLNNLGEMLHEEEKGVLYKYTEITALFHALYSLIKRKLLVPAQVNSSSLHDVYCTYYNNHFNMVFVTTKGNGTAMKKIIVEAFKWLNPSKLWKQYDIILRGMGLKPNKSEFAWCVNEINKCIKNDISLLIIGKITYGANMTNRSSKLTDTLRAAHSKLSLVNITGSSVPDSLSNKSFPSSTLEHTLKVSGMGGYYIKKYIDYISGGSILTKLINGHLIVFSASKHDWLLREMANSKRLELFLAEYGKNPLKEKLTSIIMIDAAKEGIDAKSLGGLKAGLKPSDIKSSIKSELAKNK